MTDGDQRFDKSKECLKLLLWGGLNELIRKPKGSWGSSKAQSRWVVISVEYGTICLAVHFSSKAWQQAWRKKLSLF